MVRIPALAVLGGISTVCYIVRLRGIAMRTFDNDVFDNEMCIWKYMRLTRFMDMLENQQIYFAAATEFTDPFEGAVAVQPHDWPVDDRYVEPEMFERAFEALRRLTKISCWHIEDYESTAMWDLYSGFGKGVAISSNPLRVSEGLENFRLKPEFGVEDLWGGQVQYHDLMIERLQVRMLERFYRKHRAFSWEKEFRFAIAVRRAEEFGVEVPNKGILVGLDPKAVIEKIHIGPLLSDIERSDIVRICAEHGLEDRVHVTSMLGRPRYV